MRILPGICRFWRALSLPPRTVGEAVSFPHNLFLYAAILTSLSIPNIFAGDPIPAIVDFHEQLKKRGIDLLLMPVPPKAAIYPEKILPEVDLHGETAAPYLARFYDELRGRGIDVVDLAPVFLQNRASEHGPVFCKTDSHWSGFGCVLAAQTITEKIHEKLAGQPKKNYAAEWKETTIKGDLGDLPGLNTKKPEPEKIAVRTISDK